MFKGTRLPLLDEGRTISSGGLHQKNMLWFRRLKKGAVVLAFVAVFLLGYLAISVPTSCQADAATCGCNGQEMSDCIVPFVTNQETTIENWAELVEEYTDKVTEVLVGDPPGTGYFSELVLAYGLRVREKTKEVTRNMEDWWDAFWWYNMRPAMQDMTAQLSAVNADQASALGKFEDAADMNRTIREIQKKELESHRENRVSEQSCVAATVSGGMTRTASFRKHYNAAAPVEKSFRGANSTDTVPGTGAAPASAKGKAADQAARWKKYVLKYCNPAANGGVGGCAGNNTVAGTLGADKDLDVVTQIFAKDTINLKDADTKTIVDDIIENIAEPFVLENIEPSSLESPAGQEEYLKGESYKAKRQAIYDALYFVVARRAPGSRSATGGTSTNFLREIRDSAGVPGSLLSDNPSHNEIMEVMMSERFRTGKHSIEQVDEPENNEKEMVIQQAFEAMQLSDMLDLMDRYSMVLAAQTGAEIAETKPFDSRIRDKKRK